MDGEGEVETQDCAVTEYGETTRLTIMNTKNIRLGVRPSSE
jgi:hypothetical protein